ncbi:hypothetical protein B0O99DRAFT_743960 [Bisporella sp. PMI_857]|nr:hypothetical protein B0O99DRAFT_743960 [Bisporella sp. PMI_857]
MSSTTQITQNIQVLATKSQTLIAPAQAMNITNAPLLLIGQGPWSQVITGFTDILTTGSQFVAGINPTSKFDGRDATSISDAWGTFVRVHQQLLHTLIGKGASQVTMVPFVGPPITAVLKSDESILDTIGVSLSGVIKDGTIDRIKNDLGLLDQTLEQALKAFAGQLQ